MMCNISKIATTGMNLATEEASEVACVQSFFCKIKTPRRLVPRKLSLPVSGPLSLVKYRLKSLYLNLKHECFRQILFLVSRQLGQILHVRNSNITSIPSSLKGLGWGGGIVTRPFLS